MSHVPLPPDLPGISGPMAAYPESGVHLRALANALLRGASSLTPGERETIAAYVSARNHCTFCTLSHAAVARHLLGEDRHVVDAVLKDAATSPASPKLRALLAIADKVRGDARQVTDADVRAARDAGADDKAIHDTVLIAAAFCMYNRYVDGLATAAPTDPLLYEAAGARLAEGGYRPGPRG